MIKRWAGTTKPTACAMSQPPKHSLRWVVIDPELVTQALVEHAISSDTVDLRADGYGFGHTLVADLARSLGLQVGEGDSRWAERAHQLGAHRLNTEIINLKRVPAASTVSYGGHYQTSSETTLALCALGFADGVPRLNPVGGEVSVGGKRFPIAGRIAMDQLIVDVGEAKLQLGETVIVWGDAVALSEWARWSSRSEVAIASALSPRVSRFIEAGDHG